MGRIVKYRSFPLSLRSSRAIRGYGGKILASSGLALKRRGIQRNGNDVSLLGRQAYILTRVYVCFSGVTTGYLALGMTSVRCVSGTPLTVIRPCHSVLAYRGDSAMRRGCSHE